MSGKCRIISEHGVIADFAVVGDVTVGHQPVVVAEPRDATALRCAAIDTAVFPDGIAIADLKPRFAAARKLLVLRIVA